MWWKYTCILYMYESRKMRPIETIRRMGGRGNKGE
jgi:hypothetical protein